MRMFCFYLDRKDVSGSLLDVSTFNVTFPIISYLFVSFRGRRVR